VDTVDRVVAERGVAGLAATACVRVRDAAGEVVGSGFLVGPDLVATCAHVVADALRSDPYAAQAPAAPLSVDFPVLPGGPVARSAAVHRWVPIAEDGTGDVALLRLATPAPPGAVMPPVRRVDGLWDHRFRAFGFPEGRVDGVWTTGVIRAAQGTGWFQLQTTVGEQPVEGGFSGCPVWDDETGAVVGMTVASDRDPSVTTAYLIPVADVLGLDPELLPSPYRGLEPFSEEHAEYFFGRDPEVARLREAVHRCPLVAVAGPSGAGKSSLVRAGLLPELRACGARLAQVRQRPDAPILLDVAAAVLELADPGSAQARRSRDAERIAAELAAPGTRAGALAELTAALAGAAGARVVLVVDQFEELAEADPDTARELLEVLAGLTAAGGADAALRVVLTVRGLALDEVLTPAVAEALGSGTVLVGPLDRARLREAIVRPAERAPGLAFDDGLVERILEDAGTEPGQLPLVESLLAQLWARREGGSLTTRGYEAAGGVAGALAAHAEQAVGAGFPAPEQLARLRLLLTRLAVPGRDGRFVRRTVRYTELPEQLRELVPPLASGRLVVVAGGSGAAGTVELAHQSLIEHWPRLRDWLAADRDFLAWRAELDADVARWDSGGRDDGALRRGTALAAGEAWTVGRAAELTEAEREYLAASQARRHRDVRRRRVVIAALAVLALIAGTVTVIAVRGGGQLSARQATANAETLGQESAAHAQSNPVLAAQLALAAWRSDLRNNAARSALGGQYLAFSATDAVVTGTAGDPKITGSLAGGSTSFGAVELLTRGKRPTIVTNALGSRPEVIELTDPTATNASLSPDGRTYAYFTSNGAIFVWNLTDHSTPQQLVAPNGPPLTFIGFGTDFRLSWAVRQPSGQLVLSRYSPDTHAIRNDVVEVDREASSITSTPDPDLVLVRMGAANQPNHRVVLRSISRNVDVRALPDGAEIGANGAYTLTCAPRSTATGAGSDGVVTVSDAVTGAGVRQIELMPGVTCDHHWTTADGRYVLETDFLLPGAQQNAWRATELSTGRSFQFTTPPMDYVNWPNSGRSPVISVFPDGNGGAVAMVACGPSLLRVHTVLEVPASIDRESAIRMLAKNGTVLVTINKSDLATYDPATGRQLASRAGLFSPDAQWTFDDDLWIADRGQQSWEISRISLPSLTSVVHIAMPPGGTGPGKNGIDVTVSGPVEGPSRTVFGLVDGTLLAWDAATGQPIGKPLRLVHGASDEQWYRSGDVGLWPRVGHPEQVLAAAPNGRLQLWDVPAGRLIYDLPISPANGSAVAASGDRLAARTGVGAGAVEIWDLTTGAQIAGGLQLQGVDNLRGYDSDGRLIATRELHPTDERVLFYDVERRAEEGSIVPASFGELTSEVGGFTLGGVLDLMPQRIAGSATQWHDQVCRVVPAEYSKAALDLLPAGTDTSSPCRPAGH